MTRNVLPDTARFWLAMTCAILLLGLAADEVTRGHWSTAVVISSLSLAYAYGAVAD